MRGKYIVVEGHDGTGKSTQVNLLRKKLESEGKKTIEFHEPEGSPIANEIRTIIKNGSLPRDSTTNLLLFTAARHEIWREAEKQLQEGIWVLAARNYFSTLAYQGYGEGLDSNLILSTTRQFTSPSYMEPNLAVILTLNNEKVREARIQKRGALMNPDTFESRDDTFQAKVKDGYLKIASDFHLPLIPSDQDPDTITEQIYAML